MKNNVRKFVYYAHVIIRGAITICRFLLILIILCDLYSSLATIGSIGNVVTCIIVIASFHSQVTLLKCWQRRFTKVSGPSSSQSTFDRKWRGKRLKLRLQNETFDIVYIIFEVIQILKYLKGKMREPRCLFLKER